MGLIVSLIPLILVVICFFKESKTTGLYKTFGVYGRLTAYLFLVCMAGPIAIGEELYQVIKNGEKINMGTVLVGIALTVIGVLFYLRLYAKCPDFLRKKLLISLFISSWGVTFKIFLFFIGSVWKLIEPKNVILGNGQSGYIFDGDVYTDDGTCVGSMNDSNTFTANSNYKN